MASEKDSPPAPPANYAGHDLKSILINLASILLFVFPIAAFLYTDYVAHMAGVVACGFLAAFVAPPMGWMRPHPYSDMPGNRPKQS